MSAREAGGVRVTSELLWLHTPQHASLTQCLLMSCSDPLTNMRGNVYSKSLSWMLKPNSLLHCLQWTIIAKEDSSCSSTHVRVFLEL